MQGKSLATATGDSKNALSAPTIPTGRAMWVMLIIMLASNLLASFSQSLMNIALDQVSTDYHISLSIANWLVLGFSIVAATVITMAASLLKRFGVRVVMIAGYAFALIGSVLGLFAANFPMMLAARLIQALTVGLFFPVVTSVILTLAPADKKGTLLALNSGVIGVGLAFAPLLAGYLQTTFGVRSLFAITLVMSLILIVLGVFCLHDLYQREVQHIDALSVILSFIGMGTLMYGLNEIMRYPLPSAICMVIGLGTLAFFAWRQFAIKDPLLNLQPFKHPRFVTGEILMMMGYMGSIYMSLLVPLYLEGTAGYTPFIAGALMAAPILCYAISCFVSGRIEDKYGIWPVVPLGFLLLFIGFLGMGLTSVHQLIIPMMICSALSYVGVGFVFPTLKANDLGVLPKDLYAHGAAIHSTLVQIAGSIGSALFVGIMSADADVLIAHGAKKAAAYAAGFSHTLIIDLVILAVALIGAIVFARIMHKRRMASK